MPRKTTRASRQSGGQRRVTVRPRHDAPATQQPGQTAAATPTAEAPIATPPASVATSAPTRSVRRPGGVTNPTGVLSTEQTRNEIRYIRSDLWKLLLSTVVVIIFMVAAGLLVG
ncbi:MAG: hypothetical protein M3Q29_20490 [Chloroflexota bacterium]|nr:hypothetical protein [Chloroflexota bacterium]